MTKKKLPALMRELTGEIDAALDKLEAASSTPSPDGQPARAISLVDAQQCSWCNFSAWVRLFGIQKPLADGGVERVQLFQCRKCRRYTVLRWQEAAPDRG